MCEFHNHIHMMYAALPQLINSILLPIGAAQNVSAAYTRLPNFHPLAERIDRLKVAFADLLSFSFPVSSPGGTEVPGGRGQ